MIAYELVTGKIDKIKLKIKNEMKKSNYDDALELIAFAADILYCSNLYYRDDDLERSIEYISSIILKDSSAYHADKNTVLVWDGFGLDTRGLMQIYLKALCQCQKVVYVTYSDRRKNIPSLLEILERSRCEVCFIERGRKVDEIRQLENCVKKFQPESFFLYSLPEDVTATSIMYAYQGKFRRYQINLTDHAFWLGAGCLDICIEFREYGANISSEYREIDKKKIVLLPYYPVYNWQQPFEGYPFPFDESRQRLIFSGGSLYKTIGEGNEYYEVVSYILESYPDVVFWYAGTGKSNQMDKLIAKYPKRVFLTEERKDLFQVMKKCLFYLNTYPMVGGLMMQYAAIAGKVPITLRHGNDGSGILIGQDDLAIEFDDVKSLKMEIDKLLSDAEYLGKKSEKMKTAVISEKQFNDEIAGLLQGEPGNFPLGFQHEDTKTFRESYLFRMSEGELYGIFARRRGNSAVFRNFPIQFFRGAVYKISMKLKNLMR